MEPARPLTAELYRSQASRGKFGQPQPMESDRPGAILAYTARPMDLLALWPWLLVLVACSLLAGVVAGLLGVGGGIVLVPVLDVILRAGGVSADWSMHIAIATSLATIIPTALVSSMAHHARGGVDWGIARAWAPGMLCGALAGSLLAAQTPDAWLAGGFGMVAAAVAAKMLLTSPDLRLADTSPRGVGGNLIAAVIGGLSAMMGIGGGTLSVPAMTLTGGAIHQAVGTAAFFGLLIALPGTLGYLSADPATALPPLTLGLVSLPALAIVAPCTMLTAPWGARLAHRLPRQLLSRVFGVFLAIVALRMFYRMSTSF